MFDKKLRECLKYDRGEEMDYLSYLTEEVGEVATCLAVKKGLKNKVPKETTEQECCDVIVTALALAYKSNPKWKWSDVTAYLEKKIDRWHKRTVPARLMNS